MSEIFNFIKRLIVFLKEDIKLYLVTIGSGFYSMYKSSIIDYTAALENISVLFSTLTAILGFFYALIKLFILIKKAKNEK